jgi:uncharacterized membrane protein
MHYVILTLRLVHIVGGVCWVGAAVFVTFLLGPSLKAAGPAGGAVMEQLRRRRFHDWLLGAGLVTMGSGAWLLWIVSGGLSAAWLESGMGVAILTGLAASLVALLIALGWLRPISAQLALLEERIAGEGRPPSFEEQNTLLGLRGAMAAWSVRSSVVLLLAAATMAVGRYL